MSLKRFTTWFKRTIYPREPVFTPRALASAIEDAMNAVEGRRKYAVTYDSGTGLFTITDDLPPACPSHRAAIQRWLGEAQSMCGRP